MFISPNGNAVVWKYKYVSSLINWVDFLSIFQVPHGIIIRDDDYVFLMGQDTANNALLHIFKITFSSNVYNFANKIICTSNCALSNTESILSSDSSKIYSLFNLENPSYQYFITQNETDGSVIGSWYRSSISWIDVNGSAKNSNMLLFSIVCLPNNYLLMFNTSSLVFTIKKLNSISLYGIAFESTTGK